MSERPDPSLLVSVFPLVFVRPEEVEGIPPELFDYKTAFGGKTWSDVLDEQYKKNSDAFFCMDHQTLRHFIGGYLKSILFDPDSLTSEMLVYFTGNKSFIEFCGVLSDQQVDFLIATVDWLIRDDYFSNQDRESYARSRRAIVGS